MDTERKVSQLDADIHEIYDLLKDLREGQAALQRSSSEQWGMTRRQGNRLDSLEANVAQLADDVAQLKTNVAELNIDIAELKGSVGEILTLLRAGRG